MEEYSISGLYYNYKNMSDDDIKKKLETIQIVKKDHKGVGTEFGYYPLSKEAVDKILENPRGRSLTFDATETGEKPMKGLREGKTFTYLVKSSSRFFLKPDVGEIFDQVNFRDFYDDSFKAILFDGSYENVPDTQGEHFLMKATMLHEEQDV